MMSELERLLTRYSILEGSKDSIENAYLALKNTYQRGGKLLVCGNGGSAADSEHIVGELMKGFRKKRPIPECERERIGELADHLQGALPAIALTGHAALSTAFLNDVAPDMVFAQQVYGYGREGDALLAITTSGNSKECPECRESGKGEKPDGDRAYRTGWRGTPNSFGCLHLCSWFLYSGYPGAAPSGLSCVVRDAGGHFFLKSQQKAMSAWLTASGNQHKHQGNQGG